MAQKGLSPSVARPAAKVTACCSAIPTSKHLYGNLFWNRLSPVPPPIAAWMATILSSFSASAIKDSAKYWVYDRVFDFDFNCFPVLVSNFTTPIENKTCQVNWKGMTSQTTIEIFLLLLLSF